MAQYGCAQITAKANENVIPLLFKELTGNIPVNTKCKVKFIGFELAGGTGLKINGIPNQVPSVGIFITPYDGINYMTIQTLTFDEGCSDLNIWFIY